MQSLIISQEKWENIPEVKVATDKNKSLFTREVGNMTLINVQYWVTKDAIVKILSASVFRAGFEIYNHSAHTIYIGVTDSVDLLKMIGRPVTPNSPFSSASYQGDLYCVADDSVLLGSVDVRVWEEQL
jgi:hypothetical protein